MRGSAIAASLAVSLVLLSGISAYAQAAGQTKPAQPAPATPTQPPATAAPSPAPAQPPAPFPAGAKFAYINPQRIFQESTDGKAAVGRVSTLTQKKQAEGQAKATFARLEAEAKGQYEILAKKGEGLKQIIEACGGAPQAFQLLMLEHLDNLAQTAATAISNIKFDKIIVWDNANGNGQGTSNTAHFLQSMARTLPPMMQVMKDIGGVEMPEFLARLSPEPGSIPPGAGGSRVAGNGAETTAPKG